MQKNDIKTDLDSLERKKARILKELELIEVENEISDLKVEIGGENPSENLTVVAFSVILLL